MNKSRYFATTIVAALIGTGAMATPVSIDQIGAIWQNPTFANTVPFTIDNGDGDPALNGETVSIFWGVPFISNGGQSGYSFTPAGVSFGAMPGIAYSLGTFTHFNEPISAPPGSLSSVELAFHFEGSPDGVPVTAGFNAIFDFGHNETTNTSGLGGCGSQQVSTTPCDDIVTVTAQGGASETVTVGDTEFIFTLLGFSPDGMNFNSIFVTEEGETNSQDLYFSYTVSVVPLPAAGWLLLAGIGGLAAVGRRRRKAA
jgi:hypothetical protein